MIKDDKIELNTTDTPLGVMRREIKGKVVGFFTTFPDKENGLLKPSYFMKLKPLDGSRVENIFLGNIVAGWWTFKKLIL